MQSKTGGKQVSGLPPNPSFWPLVFFSNSCFIGPLRTIMSHNDHT